MSFRLRPARDPRRGRRRIPSETIREMTSLCCGRRRRTLTRPIERSWAAFVLTLWNSRHRITTDASSSDTCDDSMLFQRPMAVISKQYTVYNVETPLQFGKIDAQTHTVQPILAHAHTSCHGDKSHSPLVGVTIEYALGTRPLPFCAPACSLSGINHFSKRLQSKAS